MYAQEKIKPYTGKAEKGKMVKSMFDTISPTYDKLNLLMSWGIDRRWRKALIDSLKPWRPQHILDVATGTGDLAILAAKSLKPQQVTGADFSEGMMEIGREKAAREGLGEVDKGLAEMCRVLKKGGRLAIVELTTPQRFPMKQLFGLYSHTILPLYGNLISHDVKAYRYLTQTIEAFPQGEQMTEILKNAGFEEASFRRLTCGICTLYLATK